MLVPNQIEISSARNAPTPTWHMLRVDIVYATVPEAVSPTAVAAYLLVPFDVSQHPGGHVIFTHAGDDFTDIFAAFHPASAYAALDPFLIGYLESSCVMKKPKAQQEFEAAYRELRSKLVMMGMFKAE